VSKEFPPRLVWAERIDYVKGVGAGQTLEATPFTLGPFAVRKLMV
jgi:hypothetical protein